MRFARTFIAGAVFSVLASAASGYDADWQRGRVHAQPVERPAAQEEDSARAILLSRQREREAVLRALPVAFERVASTQRPTMEALSAAVQRLIRGHELGHAQLKTGPAQAYEELEQQIVEVGRWRL